MKKITIKEIFDIEFNFNLNKEKIFECFIEFYGEEYRKYILNKFENTEIYFSNINISSKLEHYKYLEFILAELLNNANTLYILNNLLQSKGYKEWTIDYIEKELINIEDIIAYEHTLKYKIDEKCSKFLSEDIDDTTALKILEIILTNEDFMTLLKLDYEQNDNVFDKINIIKNFNYFTSENNMNTVGLNLSSENKNKVFISKFNNLSLLETLVHELNHNFIDVKCDNNLFISEIELEVLNEALTYKIVEIIKKNKINIQPIDIYYNNSVYKDHIHIFELVVDKLKDELLLDFKDILNKRNQSDYLYRTFAKMGLENYQKLTNILSKDIILVKRLYNENITEDEQMKIYIKREELRKEVKFINEEIINKINKKDISVY